MKLNITTALAVTLTAFLTPVIEGNGKLWDNTCGAYNAALVDFPKPADAANAIRQHIKDTLKANPKSVNSYLNTLGWLVDNGHRDRIGSGIKMGEADALRYPKAPKPGEPGYMEAQAKKNADAVAKKEQAEREAAERATPRSQLLSQIAQLLTGCDEAELSLIAAELASIVETLKGPTEVEEPEVEAEVA